MPLRHTSPSTPPVKTTCYNIKPFSLYKHTHRHTNTHTYMPQTNTPAYLSWLKSQNTSLKSKSIKSPHMQRQPAFSLSLLLSLFYSFSLSPLSSCLSFTLQSLPSLLLSQRQLASPDLSMPARKHRHMRIHVTMTSAQSPPLRSFPFCSEWQSNRLMRE